MRNMITILVVAVAVLGFSVLSFGEVITSTPSGGSGGGFILPPIGTSNTIQMSGPGYNLNGRSENNPKQEHDYSYYDKDGNEVVYNWTEPKNGNANFWGTIEQGAFAGRNFVPYNTSLEIRYEKGTYRVGFELQVLFTGQEQMNWTEPGNISTSNNGQVFGGASYNVGFSVEHDGNWTYDEKLDEYFFTETNNLRFDVYSYFEESEISNLWLNTDSWTMWYDETEYPGARISGSFDVNWDGAINFPYDSIPDVKVSSSVPEPATLALLLLGGIGTLIRRRRRRG